MQSDLRFGAYEGRAIEGTENKLILSLAGIGNPATNSMAYEWKKTLDHVTKAHVIYIKDQSRSWYNDPDGFDDLIAYLQDYITRHQITEVIALGLSMGAYGALVLSKHLPITRVISISNRFNLGLEVGDMRNAAFIEAVQPARFPDMTDCPNPKSDYLFFFCLDDHSDMKHLALAAKSGFYGRFYIYRGNHNLGVTLDRYRPDFLKAMIEGDETPLTSSGFLQISEKEAQQIHALTTVHGIPAWDHYLAANPVPPRHFISKSQLQSFEGALAKRKAALLETHYTPETFAPYLIQGWSKPEKTGVWSVGERQILSMSLADAPFAKMIEVRLDLRGFLPEGLARQRVNIRANGKVKARVVLEEKRNYVVTFTIPSRRQLELILETPDCATPKAYGISSDSRELAIFLRSVQIRKVWTA